LASDNTLEAREAARMNVLRVVIADDHALFREGLRQLLDSVEDVSVVAEASNGRHAVTLVAQHLPDDVLMDISMPEMDGIQATEMIVARQPETQVVILTMYADDEYITHAIRAGAKGTCASTRARTRSRAPSGWPPPATPLLAPEVEQALLREFQRLVHGQPAVKRGDITARTKVTHLARARFEQSRNRRCAASD
jgi:CheY-like chemotaxis protein